MGGKGGRRHTSRRSIAGVLRFALAGREEQPRHFFSALTLFNIFGIAPSRNLCGIPHHSKKDIVGILFQVQKGIQLAALPASGDLPFPLYPR